jgi:hypothetical protein
MDQSLILADWRPSQESGGIKSASNDTLSAVKQSSRVVPSKPNSVSQGKEKER